MTRKLVDEAVILPDASPVLTLARIARLKNAHLLTTTAWLMTRQSEGYSPEALDLVEQINSTRETSMLPFEKVGLTKKLRSIWLRRSFDS